MNMNHNTDSKATLQLNLEIHSENCQTSKMELYLGNSQRLKPLAIFAKKTPSHTLNGDPSKKNR